MFIIYRGLGIVVPIVLFISGWIVSFWIKDARVGNATFMGWTLFYTSIVSFFLGIATFGGKDEKGNPIPKNQHHLFYIPILFWSLILGGLSAYLLLAKGHTPGEPPEESLAVDTIPKIHFYNPTDDTLLYVISDESGLFEKEKLEPFSAYETEVSAKSYLLAGLNLAGDITAALPSDEHYDQKLYETMKEGEATVRQRIIRKPAGLPGSYEQNWMLLDASYDLVLVDVTGIYDGIVQTEKIAQTDWTKKIKSRHPGNELIELMLRPTTPYTSVYLSEPYTYLPVSNSSHRAVYMIVVLRHGEEASNALIRDAVQQVVIS